MSLECSKCDRKFLPTTFNRKFKAGVAFRQHMMIEHTETEEEVMKEWEMKLKKCREERNQIKRERAKVRRQRRTVCEICSKDVFFHRLKSHLKTHNNRNDFALRQNFNCTMCAVGKNIRNKDTLERHMVQWHSGIVYKCDFCDHTSSNPQRKRSHMASWHWEKTFKCDYCDKMYSEDSRLAQHIKVRHEKVKTKQCPHCGEAFQASRAFTAHVNRHTNNRQFACATCGKSYLMMSHLKEHEKRHTQPYLCNECDRRFGAAENLKRHIKTVHEQEQIQLECRHGCGWTYTQPTSRNRHEKTCR